MFGGLRFFLASVVVSFHAGVTPFGVWTGVSAVVVFYILSGYVITALLTTRFPSLGAIGAFLAERGVRIAPQYYFWLAVAFIRVFLFRWVPIPPGQPSAYSIFSYLTLLPIGLQPYIKNLDFLFNSVVTSLANEGIIYLMAPFIVRSRLASWIAAAICSVIFLLSATRVLPPNIYTYYYYAPAQLLFFLLGSFIYRREWLMLAVTSGVLGALLVLGHYLTFFPEMLIGVAFGVPAILLLRTREPNRWDGIFGDISYGCFLCQEFVFYALVHFGFIKGTPTYIGLSLLLSWIFGYGSFLLVERPTITFRRHFRARRGSVAVPIQPSATRPMPAGL